MKTAEMPGTGQKRHTWGGNQSNQVRYAWLAWQRLHPLPSLVTCSWRDVHLQVGSIIHSYLSSEHGPDVQLPKILVDTAYKACPWHLEDNSQARLQVLGSDTAEVILAADEIPSQTTMKGNTIDSHVHKHCVIRITSRWKLVC